jgi:hypothetical protein
MSRYIVDAETGRIFRRDETGFHEARPIKDAMTGKYFDPDTGEEIPKEIIATSQRIMAELKKQP